MNQDSLRQNFPVTLKSLGEFETTLKSFNDFMLSLETMDEDSLRWFPRFLKQQKYPDQVWQAAQVEYILNTLKDRSMGPPLLKTSIAIHPDLTTQFLSQDLPLLGLPKGLYAFYLQGSAVRCRRLTEGEAEVLDILSESLEITFHQLIEMATLNGDLREQKQKTIQTLIDEGLLTGQGDL